VLRHSATPERTLCGAKQPHGAAALGLLIKVTQSSDVQLLTGQNLALLTAGKRAPRDFEVQR